MVRFRGLIPKKPWAKDVKEDLPEEPKACQDEFVEEDLEESEGEGDTYEYYDDDDDGDDWQKGNRMSINPSMGPPSSRMSTITDFKQNSMYFDYQLSSRKLGGAAAKPKKQRDPRLSTGIVTHTTGVAPPPPPRGRPAGGRGRGPSTRPKAVPLAPMADCIDEGEEGEEEASEDEKAPPVVKRRSLSPDIVRTRPGMMTRNNSWTSNRDLLPSKPLEAKPKKKKKKKKKVEGSSGEKVIKKKKKGTGTKKKSRTPSPNSRRRDDMVRRNSWSSSRKIESGSGKPDRFLSLHTPKGSAIVEEDEKSTSSKSSKKSTGSKTKKKVTGTKKGTKAADPQSSSTLESAVPKTISSPETKKNFFPAIRKPSFPKIPRKPPRDNQAADKKKIDLLEGLRKTRAAITSIGMLSQNIGVLSQKPDLDKQGAVALKKQLDDAVAQIETLHEVIETTSSEVADFTGMLSESAKENNELLDQLEETQASMIEYDNKIEELTKELEEVGEQKKALASNLLRSDDDLKSLISQMKVMEQGSMGGGAHMSEVFELQKSVNDKELKIDEQAKELDERDAKILALERQLGSDGGVCETQEIDKVNAELGALKKKHKTDQLESSVHFAKQDAMIASLQDQLDHAKEGDEQEAQVSSSLREELENSKENLREALLGVLEAKTYQQKIEELEQRVQDAETVEKGLQDAIDKWTDKTFEWKEKAEGLEMELNQLRSRDSYAPRISETSQPGLWGVFGA